MNEVLMCGTDPVGQLYKDTKAEATSIAPIEVSPAESSHNVGTHIMYGGIRYKVTSAISIGDTLTIGTNISAENIEDNLKAENIAYDSNNSVKDMIDKIGYTEVARGNANQTYAQQLEQLQTAFNALSGEERMRSVIFTNGQYFYPSDSNNRAIYSCLYIAGGVVAVSLDILNKTRKYILNNFTIVDNSSDNNASIMFLYVLDKMS